LQAKGWSQPSGHCTEKHQRTNRFHNTIGEENKANINTLVEEVAKFKV
jgi:hypothetical protein